LCGGLSEVDCPRRCCCQLRIPAAPPHAATFLRLQARQRRRRYPLATSLPGAQEHPAHGALFRAVTQPVQGLLEGLELMKKTIPRRAVSGNGNSACRQLSSQLQSILQLRENSGRKQGVDSYCRIPTL